MVKLNIIADFQLYLYIESAIEMTKKIYLLGLILLFVGLSNPILAQCSICTKTASQLGEGPAAALNSAIIYLAFTPFAIVAFIGYKWWKNEKAINQD